MNLFAKKPLERIIAESESGEHKLKRTLGAGGAAIVVRVLLMVRNIQMLMHSALLPGFPVCSSVLLPVFPCASPRPFWQ